MCYTIWINFISQVLQSGGRKQIVSTAFRYFMKQLVGELGGVALEVDKRSLS